MKATAKVKTILPVSTPHIVLRDSSFPFSSFLWEEVLKTGYYEESLFSRREFGNFLTFKLYRAQGKNPD